MKLRNEAARQLGYPDFYNLKLQKNEQEEEEIFRIFDALAELTEGTFGEIKSDIDSKLSARYGIKPDAMRPWHYQDFFFQEIPDLGQANLDGYFQNRDIREIAVSFFDSIGCIFFGIVPSVVLNVIAPSMQQLLNRRTTSVELWTTW